MATAPSLGRAPVRGNYPGTYKKTATKTSPQGKPPAKPTSQDAIAQAVQSLLQPQIGAQTDANNQALQTLSGYYQGYGKILGGIPGQIGSAYGDAGKEIGSLAQGFSGATRDRLGAAGSALESQISRQAGSEYGSDIAPSFNADKVGDLSYALGGYIPASSLAKQGAAWQAGADLLPLKAYGEGEYALDAQKKAGDAALAKVMQQYPSLYTKLLTQQQNTATKLAGIDAANKRSDAIISGENTRSANSIAATNARTAANLSFKTQKANQDYQLALQKGAKPNAALSAKYGYVVDSNGHAVLNSKGRHIPVVKTGSAAANKPLSVSQASKLDSLAESWFKGAPQKFVNKVDSSGQLQQYPLPGAGAGAISYQVALRKLTTTYHQTLAQAQSLLNTYYPDPVELLREAVAHAGGKGLTTQQIRAITKAAKGRPLLSFQERQALIKRGIPKALVNKAAQDVYTYEQIAASINGGPTVDNFTWGS